MTRSETLRSDYHVERMRRQNARLLSDPAYKKSLMEKIAAAARTPEARARVASQSKTLWQLQRDKIIAAQNAGKGEEWRRKQSEGKRRLWAVPGNKMAQAMARRRVISDDDVAAIRSRLSAGERNYRLADEYGVDPSLISHIKAGRKR